MRRSLRFFGVAAFVLCTAACTSTSPTPGRSPNRVTASPARPPAIEGLTIHEPVWTWERSDWALHLVWDPPTGSPIERYEVARNGSVVDEQVAEAAWTDPQVRPGARYRYAVIGITEDGGRTLPARTSIVTGMPPLADARLQGSFVMMMRVEDSVGTHGHVEGGRVVFRFDPRCARGPCSVRWTVRDRATDVLLDRDGTTYAARAETPLLIRNCLGGETAEEVDATFDVVEAAATRGRWRATKIEGSITERSVWEGCMTASITWDVRGIVHA